MNFKRKVYNEHLTEVLDAHKNGKLPIEKALEKIYDASLYISNSVEYEKSQKEKYERKKLDKIENNKIHSDDH